MQSDARLKLFRSKTIYETQKVKEGALALVMLGWCYWFCFGGENQDEQQGLRPCLQFHLKNRQRILPLPRILETKAFVMFASLVFEAELQVGDLKGEAKAEVANEKFTSSEQNVEGT